MPLRCLRSQPRPGARAADLPLPPLAATADRRIRRLRLVSPRRHRHDQSVGQGLDNALYSTAASVRDGAEGFRLLAAVRPRRRLPIANNWFRTDVTGEYRGKANFHGLDIVRTTTGASLTDKYTGSKSEWLVLANVYADLGTWYSFTPFIGAGVGAAYNHDQQLHRHLRDRRRLSGSNVATGAHRVEVESRLGGARRRHLQGEQRSSPSSSPTATSISATRCPAISSPARGATASTTRWSSSTSPSYDLKFGMRWLLEPPMPVQQPMMLPPLIRKG